MKQLNFKLDDRNIQALNDLINEIRSDPLFPTEALERFLELIELILDSPDIFGKFFRLDCKSLAAETGDFSAVIGFEPTDVFLKLVTAVRTRDVNRVIVELESCYNIALDAKLKGS